MNKEEIKEQIHNTISEWVSDPASWINNENECKIYLDKLLDKLVKNDVV